MEPRHAEMICASVTIIVGISIRPSKGTSTFSLVPCLGCSRHLVSCFVAVAWGDCAFRLESLSKKLDKCDVKAAREFAVMLGANDTPPLIMACVHEE